MTELFLDKFMDLSTTGMCHLKVNNEAININVGLCRVHSPTNAVLLI